MESTIGELASCRVWLPSVIISVSCHHTCFVLLLGFHNMVFFTRWGCPLHHRTSSFVGIGTNKSIKKGEAMLSVPDKRYSCTGKYPRMSVYTPLLTPYYAILPNKTVTIFKYFEESRHNLLVLQDSTFNATVSHDVISHIYLIVIHSLLRPVYAAASNPQGWIVVESLLTAPHVNHADVGKLFDFPPCA